MSRVLFFGDLAPTGFGTVTMDLGRRMIEAGEDVRFISLNQVNNLPEPFASRTLGVASLSTVLTDGKDFVAGLLRGGTPHRLLNEQPWGEWIPERAIILGDYQAARVFVGQHLDAFKQLLTYHYCPVEGVDLPPDWAEMWQTVHPVAMSEFGADEIEKIMGVRPPMIYHGVDAEVFHPVSSRAVRIAADDRPDVVLRSKDECKQLWMAYFGVSKFPKVWIGRTDRHMPRKRYNAFLRSLAPVLYRQHAAALIIHARTFDQGGYLCDTISKIPGLRKLPSESDLPETERPLLYGLFERDVPQIVITQAAGMGRDALVSLINAFDVYASNSAEGFGLTLAEAIACGVPAVGIGYSAVPEVIGPAGTVVENVYLLDNEYDHYWATPDEEDFGKAVEFLITHQSRREELGRKGPKHVAAHFDWDHKARQFAELLNASEPVEAVA